MVVVESVITLLTEVCWVCGLKQNLIINPLKKIRVQLEKTNKRTNNNKKSKSNQQRITIRPMLRGISSVPRRG